MYSAVFRKLWQEVGGRLLTYFVVLLTLGLMGGIEPALVLYIMLTMVLVTDLGVQIAGDDVRHGAFEFIFTRAIDRRAYYTSRYLFGLGVVAALLAGATVMEWVGLKSLFWGLISEIDPTEGLVARYHPTGFFLYLLPGLTLVYSVIFFLCTTSTRESRLSGNAVAGWLISGIYFLISDYLVQLIYHLGVREENSLVARWSDVPFFLTHSAFLLLPAVVTFIVGREYYGRCTLPRTVQSEKEGSPSWILWLVVLLAAIVILGALYMTASSGVESNGG